MKVAFVSNYINHHQIPLCDALFGRPEVDFVFLETEPMEEERRAMGWGSAAGAPPYVKRLYEDGTLGEKLMRESDIVLFGWTKREDLARLRLSLGKPIIRLSERLYREGQWKWISPRGLADKYRSHTKYRNAQAWLLCCGAYVASDFSLIRAYPGKMYRWGYFPRTIREKGRPAESDPAGAAGGSAEPVPGAASGDRAPLRILYAGRLMPLKHPEYALMLAGALRERGIPFTLTIIGGGGMREYLEDTARKKGFSVSAGDMILPDSPDDAGIMNSPDSSVIPSDADGKPEAVDRSGQIRTEKTPGKSPGGKPQIRFTGAVSPDSVRLAMAEADLFLFPSNHLEGWGAVVNEAMNAGCCVLAGSGAGAVPYLVVQGVNGLIFRDEDGADFVAKGLWAAEHPDRIRAMGEAARRTILTEWNAETAAARLHEFMECITAGRPYVPAKSGPLSPAPVIKPFIDVPELRD